jgi:ABC-type multidrug transport system fused ATPase/permease subunit
MGTSLLDLLGVLLIGLVGALAVTTVQSLPPPSAVTQVAELAGLQGLSSQSLVGVLALAAAVVLLTKSVLSSYLTRRVFIFLANRQALVSARLTRALLSQPLTFVQRRSSQQTAFALITGASAATMTVLGQTVIIFTELAVLVVLGIALLFLSPWAALGSIAFFALVAIVLQRAMGGWATRAGEASSSADIQSLNAIQEALASYREIIVTGRRPHYVAKIQALRWQAAKVAADTQFIGMFPKYMFEAALVVGGFALAGVLFATQDSVTAVGTLALFLAAGTRVMPSLLRLQGAALGLRGAAGVASTTFHLASELGNPTEDPASQEVATAVRERIRAGHPDFNPTIELENVSVFYPGAPSPALQNITLSVASGQSVGLVGKSGSGKSTLADVILAVLEPDAGTILLGGLAPSDCLARWPGGLAYVPQDVVLANDTVRANVALGLPPDAVDDAMVWEALERAHLAAYLRNMRDGLETVVGEHGFRMSGGQRQRLGIARALYTKPRLLVLDEATSALDAETESNISQTIRELEGDVTTLIIAHRLSTIRSVDLVVYLSDGLQIATGTFTDVARSTPDFAHQAKLMGLIQD